MDDVGDLRLREAHDEIELLRSERDGARAAIFKVIAQIVEHNHENARGLARFDLDEARCRELATLYLEEAADVVRLEDDLRRIRANSKRMDEILERARALVAEEG